MRAPPDALAWAGTALLGVTLVVGLSQFWSLQASTLRCRGCPDWAAEVERFEDGQSDGLVIWPYDRPQPWVMYLDPSG